MIFHDFSPKLLNAWIFQFASVYDIESRTNLLTIPIHPYHSLRVKNSFDVKNSNKVGKIRLFSKCFCPAPEWLRILFYYFVVKSKIVAFNEIKDLVVHTNSPPPHEKFIQSRKKSTVFKISPEWLDISIWDKNRGFRCSEKYYS